MARSGEDLDKLIKALEKTKSSIEGIDMDALYLSIYMSLKSLYDKWFCTYKREDFILNKPIDDILKRKTYFEGNDKYSNADLNEFSRFAFLDSFYNDISTEMYFNPESLYHTIVDHSDAAANKSTYQVMADIASKDKCLFLSYPVPTNVYRYEEFKKIFTPSRHNLVRPGNTYIILYTHQLSHSVDGKNFEDDGFDIADVAGNPYPDSPIYKSRTFYKYRNNKNLLDLTVPSFGVTYGMQNQGIFTNITVNMDNPKMTDFSIRNLNRVATMSQSGRGTEANTIAQDAFTIYANQTYNCTVEMLGCMNIMPMMYFQLNNIPMFRGTYMIISVEHSIKPGLMKTKFVGVRINKHTLMYNTDLASMNKLQQGIKDFVNGTIDISGSSIFDAQISTPANSNRQSTGGGETTQTTSTPQQREENPRASVRKSIKIGLSDKEYICGVCN